MKRFLPKHSNKPVNEPASK
jgi:hypothetical protein